MSFVYRAEQRMRFVPPVSIVLLFLSACATQPISNLEAINAPAGRIFAPDLLAPSPGSGKVTVKRDRGLGGSACVSRVFVDAKAIADLGSSEKVVIYLPAGEHILSASPSGVCGGRMSEVNATVKSGAEQNFRIGYGSNGDYAISVTAF